jgi:hypothetical protein
MMAEGMAMAGADLLKSLGTRLFGSAPQQTSGTGRTGFDMSSLPQFQQLFGQAQAAAGTLGQRIGTENAARRAEALRGFDRQRSVLGDVFGQNIRNINQRYDSRLGGARQGAASSGLYNTSVLPGMSALVDRERNRALGGAYDRRAQMLGGVEGQQTQMLDQLQQQRIMQQLAPLLQLFGTQLMPAQVAGGATATRTDQTQKSKGLLSKLFG